MFSGFLRHYHGILQGSDKSHKNHQSVLARITTIIIIESDIRHTALRFNTMSSVIFQNFSCPYVCMF
jgi:hypothetical protein